MSAALLLALLALAFGAPLLLASARHRQLRWVDGPRLRSAAAEASTGPTADAGREPPVAPESTTRGLLPRQHALRDYYTDAGLDYALWSPGFYMHFGYARSLLETFRLERMLENLGSEALVSLGLDAAKTPVPAPALLDLGCGMGAVARQAAARWPCAEVTGLTLVPAQVRHGSRLNRMAGVDDRVRLVCDDFEHSDLPSAAYDGAWAIESACYGEGPAKGRFLAEAKRLLKPGATLAISDGFRRHGRPLPGWLRRPYRWLCDCWALPEMAQLPALLAELERLGFTDVRARDLRWRVAPSVLWVPWTTLKFFGRAVVRGELFRMKRWQWKNLVSPWLTMLLGLQARHFGYYLVTARKGVIEGARP